MVFKFKFQHWHITYIKVFWMFPPRNVKRKNSFSSHGSNLCVIAETLHITISTIKKPLFTYLPHFTKCWITLWNWEWWFATALVPKHYTLFETNTGWVVLIYLQMDTMWMCVLIRTIWFCTGEVLVAGSNALILLSIPDVFIESFFPSC